MSFNAVAALGPDAVLMVAADSMDASVDQNESTAIEGSHEHSIMRGIVGS